MKRLWPFLLALAIFVTAIAMVLVNSYTARLPGADRMCADHYGVAGDTSCQVGQAVLDSVDEAGTPQGAFTIDAYDPVGATEREFRCVPGQGVLTCTAEFGRTVIIERP